MMKQTMLSHVLEKHLLGPFPLSPCYSKEQRRQAIPLLPASIRCFPLLSDALAGAGEGGEAQSAGELFSFPVFSLARF